MTFDEWKKSIDKGPVIIEDHKQIYIKTKMTCGRTLLSAPYTRMSTDKYKCKIISSCPEGISLCLP